MKVFYVNFDTLNKLKDGDFNKEYKFPFHYFENETEFYLYLPINSVVYCSVVSKELIEDVNSFKMEYLMNAVELVRKVDKDLTLKVL